MSCAASFVATFTRMTSMEAACESGRHAVVDVPVDTEVPVDVDTWEDYESLLAQGIER